MKKHGLKRREFLKRGICAGAFLSGTGITSFPTVWASGTTAPSDRIRVGHVGIGGRGGYLLKGESLKAKDVQVVALCDVDSQHLGNAAKVCGGKVKQYVDYKRIVNRKDIDAVVVATPDHWHTLVTIDSCNAGKDVYVEKPLSTYVPEGRAMVKAARRNKRMVQVGINHRSTDYIRRIVKIVRSGQLGTVHTVKNWMWANPVKPKTPCSRPPAQLDFDRWLGPARKVPYHPDRTHYNFRWCRDYSGGYTTDWGVHMFNVMTFAMDVDYKGPVSVEAKGTFASDNIWDYPISMEAKWEFKNPDFTLTWTQPSEGGDILPGEKYGMTFYGDKGSLRTKFWGNSKFYSDGKEAPLPPPVRKVKVPYSPGHYRNWLDSIRSRKLPIADVEIGHRTTTICIIGNISLFLGRKLKWDWHKERFVNDPEANRILMPKYREPYKLM